MKANNECPLCRIGFPLEGDNHFLTQALGMIPISRCRKAIKRGDISAYRKFLNEEITDQYYINGRYRQISRSYGDYLYHQDRDRFIMQMCQWLVFIERTKC